MTPEPDAFDQLVAALVRGEEIGSSQIDEVVVRRGLTMSDVQRACDRVSQALPRIAGMLRHSSSPMMM